MGDISAEPSMEEILSSIKRIIAEEGDTPPGRQRRQSRPAPMTAPRPDIDDDMDEDEVLELSDPMPMIDRTPPRKSPPVAAAPVEPPRPPVPTHAEPAAESLESIVSRETMAATRAPLEALTRMMVKPEAGNDGTLEGLVREMLRPMLRDWMDANLPDMVEHMVAREIAKITGQPG